MSSAFILSFQESNSMLEVFHDRKRCFNFLDIHWWITTLDAYTRLMLIHSNSWQKVLCLICVRDMHCEKWLHKRGSALH